ncbi:MAG: hypothetical protein WKG01_24080, partial [Kofleriaceae bacterium]
ITAVPAIAATLCYPDDEEERAQRDTVEARRRIWMQRLWITEAEWAKDVVDWLNIEISTRSSTNMTATKDVAWSALNPVEQFALIHTAGGDSNTFSLHPGAKNYIADALPLSETARLAYVIHCIDTNVAVQWAVCQGDIEALAPAKIAAELRTDTRRTAGDRMTIRRYLAEVAELQKEFPGAMKNLAAQDPAYAKVFEIAKATRAQWASTAGSRTELLALVRKMDDARVVRSKSALAGCSEQTRAAFAKAVRKLGAKRFENVKGDSTTHVSFLENALGAVLGDVDGYLAANALYACEGATDHLLVEIGKSIGNWPGHRGPRTAIMTAIRAANLELDRQGETLVIPMTSLPLGGDRGKRLGDGTGLGVIAAIEDEGDVLRIEFPKSTGTADICVRTVRTNRISRIDDKGNVYYEIHCTKYELQKIDTTKKPVTVAKRYAAGLARGVFVETSGGTVEAVWAKPSSPRPIAAFGVLLK